MLRWIKHLFGVAVEKPAPVILRWYNRDGEVVESVPVKAVGLDLLIETDQGPRIVRSGLAVDPEEYWRLWTSLSGESYRWEDGTPFHPPRLDGG